MDKQEFVRVAPDYYVCALVLELLREASMSVDDILVKYTDDEPDQRYYYLPNMAIMREALRRLETSGHVEVLYDPFGPIQLVRTASFGSWAEQQLRARNTILYRAGASENRIDWLKRALVRLNDEDGTHEVKDEDYRREALEWEPLPLERNSEPLREAIEAVDNTLHEVETSNGYAAEHPEEREYVVDNLKLVLNRLKTALTISYGYLRTHGINVLRKLADKFSGAAMGEAAKEALKALGRWLHEVMPGIF